MKDKNQKLLNSIGKDILMWKGDYFPPGEKLINLSAGGLVIGNAAVWIYMSSNWTTQYLCSIAGAIIFPILCIRIFAKFPKTWPDVLDKKLANYKPRNIAAWRELQATALETSTLSLAVAERWYQAEKAYSLSPCASELTSLQHISQVKKRK